MLAAGLWGAVAASSLLIGAVLGVYRQWDRRFVGVVLGFGAGALISSVSFELVEEGMRAAGVIPEAKEKASVGAGFAAVIGYAVAAGLSAAS